MQWNANPSECPDSVSLLARNENPPIGYLLIWLPPPPGLFLHVQNKIGEEDLYVGGAILPRDSNGGAEEGSGTCPCYHRNHSNPDWFCRDSRRGDTWDRIHRPSLDWSRNNRRGGCFANPASEKPIGEEWRQAELSRRSNWNLGPN
jgi:hypothetical protein